jgi:hypothetical protein
MSAERGLHTLRLTVRRDLAEAHRLYQRLGYEPVAPFSDSPYAHHQLAKKLDAPPRREIDDGLPSSGAGCPGGANRRSGPRATVRRASTCRRGTAAR